MSRGTDSLTPRSAPDRPPIISSALRPQKSLSRRSDSKLIPFVVKRALSYKVSRAEKSTRTCTAGSSGNLGAETWVKETFGEAHASVKTWK